METVLFSVIAVEEAPDSELEALGDLNLADRERAEATLRRWMAGERQPAAHTGECRLTGPQAGSTTTV